MSHVRVSTKAWGTTEAVPLSDANFYNRKGELMLPDVREDAEQIASSIQGWHFNPVTGERLQEK